VFRSVNEDIVIRSRQFFFKTGLGSDGGSGNGVGVEWPVVTEEAGYNSRLNYTWENLIPRGQVNNSRHALVVLLRRSQCFC
jgi:hypothetical protein